LGVKLTLPIFKTAGIQSYSPDGPRWRQIFRQRAASIAAML